MTVFPVVVAVLLIGAFMFFWWRDHRHSQDVTHEEGRRDVHRSVSKHHHRAPDEGS